MRHSVLDNLHTREVNELANGTPVVWIHGLGESALAFERVLAHETLADRRHLAPDLLGYGKTAWTETPTSIPQHADRMVAWISSLNLPRTVLAGHSMGGVVAQLVAERIPTRVAGIINVEGNMTLADCTYSRRTTTYVLDDFLERGFGEILDDVYAKGATDPAFRSYAASMQFCDPRTFHLNGRELVTLSQSGELAERFAQVQAPTVYVAGVPGGAGEDTHRSLAAAGVSIVDIDGSGHWPFIDKPHKFVDIVAEFLATIE